MLDRENNIVQVVLMVAMVTTSVKVVTYLANTTFPVSCNELPNPIGSVEVALLSKIVRR